MECGLCLTALSRKTDLEVRDFQGLTFYLEVIRHDLRQVGIDKFIRLLRDALGVNFGERRSVKSIVLEEIAAFDNALPARSQDFTIRLSTGTELSAIVGY